MALQTIVRLHHASDLNDPDLVSWIRYEKGEVPPPPTVGSMDELAAELGGQRVTVLVPGRDVLLTAAAVPTANRKRLATAVPYVLEDQLASDIEDLHFAIGGVLADGRVSCAVVDRATIEQWNQQLRTHNINVEMMIPDTLALFYETNAWSVMCENESVWVRTSPYSGFVAELMDVEIAFQMVLAEYKDHLPTHLNVYCSNEKSGRLPDFSAMDLEVKQHNEHESALQHFCQGVNSKLTIDLLQGDFSRKEQIGKIWRPWIPAAAMLASWVMIHVVTFGIDYYQLDKRHKELNTQVRSVFSKAMPDTKMVKPKVQMQRKLEELTGGNNEQGSGFVQMLAKSGKVLKDFENMQLRSVRYKNGKIDIDLHINNLQALDELKQRLDKESGLDVEIISANSRKDKVESRIQLKGRES